MESIDDSLAVSDRPSGLDQTVIIGEIEEGNIFGEIQMDKEALKDSGDAKGANIYEDPQSGMISISKDYL